MKWMGFHSRFQLKLMNIESHPSGKRRSQFLEPSVFACFELNNFAFRDFNLFFCCKINTCTGFTHARSECSESMQCDSVSCSTTDCLIRSSVASKAFCACSFVIPAFWAMPLIKSAFFIFYIWLMIMYLQK